MDPDDTPNRPPIIQKNPDKSMLEQNMRELEKFFALDKKTKIALSVSALAVLVFALAAFTLPFGTNPNNKLYPKPASEALTPEAKKNPGFTFDAPTEVLLGNQVTLKILVRTNEISAEYFLVSLKFDSKKLKMIGVDISKSFITQWTDRSYNNSTGSATLAGKASGYKSGQSEALFATVIFKAISKGSAGINLSDQSGILTNSGQNILQNFPAVSVNIKSN